MVIGTWLVAMINGLDWWKKREREQEKTSRTGQLTNWFFVADDRCTDAEYAVAEHTRLTPLFGRWSIGRSITAIRTAALWLPYRL